MNSTLNRVSTHMKATSLSFSLSEYPTLLTSSMAATLTRCPVYLSQHDAVDTERGLLPVGGAGVKQI